MKTTTTIKRTTACCLRHSSNIMPCIIFLIIGLVAYTPETCAFASIALRPPPISLTATVVPPLPPSPVSHQTAVVVGGGPVGLATALMLSNPPHSMNVTVLEQSKGETSVAMYDPRKAYLYNINPRGLAWFDGHPDALAKLKHSGSAAVGGFGNFVVVPADPSQPIPPPKAASASGNITTFSAKRPSYWIRRHATIELLQDCLVEQEMDRQQLGLSDIGSVTVVAGQRFAGVSVNDSDGSVTVETTDGRHYAANLVVAADGIDSAVRLYLASCREQSWLASRRRSFGVKRYRSPSTGLRIKSLQFPSNFTVHDSDGSMLKTESETLYSIKSIHTGPRNFISMGLLPTKEQHGIRPTNIITRPNHQVWKLQNASQVKAWFQAAFPRMDFDSLVDDTEWERFAAASGTKFPYCQHSKGVAVSSPDGQAGVALVGDSAHAFPPDIGQGINAGLMDVIALDRALRGDDIVKGNATGRFPASLGQALDRYQRNRVPEHRALIRLARFGAPYQYNQPWRRDRLGKKMWTANVVFRVALHKLSRGLIPRTAILMAQDSKLTFRQVMRRADSTVLIIKASLLLSTFWFLARRLALLA